MRLEPHRLLALLVIALCGLAGLLPASLVASELPFQVLTEGGDLVSLQHAGPVDADADGGGDTASSGELSLVFRSPQGDVSHWPVAESTEALVARGVVYQEDLGLVFAVWESEVAAGRTRLHVATHDGRGWGTSSSLPHSGGSFRGSALLAATRKSMANGKIDARLHVAAPFENAGDDDSPRLWILRLDSEIGSRAPAGFDLASLVGDSSAEGQSTAAPGDLLLLRPGAERSEVLLGVSDTANHQLLVARVEPVSDDLTSLADDARAEIIRVGAVAPSVESLSRTVSDYVEEAAADVAPGLAGYMAYEVQRVLLEGQPGDQAALERVADDARAEITRVGLRPRVNHGPSRFEPRFLQEVSLTSEEETDAGDLISVQLMAAWPLPELIPGGSLLFLSADGRRGLFAAIRDGAVLVIQGTQGEWSEVENLGDADVLVDLTELLQRRVEWASETVGSED